MTEYCEHLVVSGRDLEVGKWLESKGAGAYRHGAVCIGNRRGNDITAAVMFDYYNGLSIFANIAIDGPYSKQWLRTICRYPFSYLQCNVVIAMVSSGNVKSRLFCENFGFVIRGRIPNADPCGDTIVYALSREDCRFIKGAHYE